MAKGNLQGVGFAKDNSPKLEERDISFYNGKGEIDPNLFDRKAKDVADKFEKGGGITYTSLRRIFGEAKHFQTDLAKKDDFAAQLPYIKMLKSKTAYTIARQKKLKGGGDKALDCLRQFIVLGIDQIKEQKDYDVFISLFEAVIGYYYEKAPK